MAPWGLPAPGSVSGKFQRIIATVVLNDNVTISVWRLGARIRGTLGDIAIRSRLRGLPHTT